MVTLYFEIGNSYGHNWYTGTPDLFAVHTQKKKISLKKALETKKFKNFNIQAAVVKPIQK